MHEYTHVRMKVRRIFFFFCKEKSAVTARNSNTKQSIFQAADIFLIKANCLMSVHARWIPPVNLLTSWWKPSNGPLVAVPAALPPPCVCSQPYSNRREQRKQTRTLGNFWFPFRGNEKKIVRQVNENQATFWQKKRQWLPIRFHLMISTLVSGLISEK